MSPLRVFATGLLLLAFFGWNFLFLTVFGAMLPEIVIELLEHAWVGRVPWDFALSGVALLLTPPAALVAWIPLRHDPARIYRLFFGLELPLFFVLGLRFGLVRELTSAVIHLLLLVGVSVFALLLDLYRRRDRPLTLPELAGHAALLVTAVWPALLVGVYVPPATVGFVRALGEVAEQVLRRPLSAGMFLFAAAFWITSFALFLVGPIAFLHAWLSTFWRVAKETAGGAGIPRTVFATLAGLTLCLAPAPLLYDQPHVAVLARLEHVPTDDAGRAALLADEAEIRAGLLDAYLAPMRYLSSTGSSRWVAQLYRDIGGGEAAQALFNTVAYPFLYQGETLGGDRERAAALYRDLFDEPLQVGEREAVLRALDTTWERSTAEAGVLDASGEKVLLARQEVTVTREGDLATVRVDEVYANQTWEQQEVYYYFSLPTSAAVTGLWLSDDPSDPERFRGVVAPRGAAQQVYTEQRVTRRDPALLEQVGPRQYRLRAFPILSRVSATEREEAHAPPLSVRFTYVTPVGPDGVPLPNLRERRNVFWDARTERVGVPDPGEAWFPAFVGEGGSAAPRAATVGGYTVEAVPASASPLTTGGRYAVVLDRSGSMRERADAVVAALGTLERDLPGADLDLYLGAGAFAGDPSLVEDPRGYTPTGWFGALSPHTLLTQYAGLRGGRSYDAVLVLTDDGGYDVTADENPDPLPDLGGPVWLVHLGEALAPAYDDAVLAAIERSGGGVAASVEEALARIADPTVLDGYRWVVTPAAADAPEPEDAAGPFGALAARQVVLAKAREGRGTLADLDAVHALAKRAGIVTPYSSLLALVDEEQRRRLAELEGREDRFEREVETGVEALDGPGDAFSVTAVPEPEEWLLLAVGLGVFLARKRRREPATG